ncbi:MAG: CCA tRNA nucleotidyltransferase [Lentisphaeria bacterium]|nr:CCA tRNA nucleotidyltransferase [Lentisphaeria bacterium]
MSFLPEQRKLFAAAVPVAERLKQHGFRGLIVGGAVRDMLLGKRASDIDMVTDADPAELARIFPQMKFVGAAFGVALIPVGEIEIEVASARSERFYLDGRHPEKVAFTRDFAADAARRDFTVNAMMYDPLSGELLDFTGGAADLERGILRTVGVAGERFAEDHLRMLRAIRFAAKSDFTIAPECWEAICRSAPATAELSGERVREELTAMLLSPRPAKAFELLEKSGILTVLLPEVSRLRQVAQPPRFHPEGDVLTHTLIMLRRMTMPTMLLAWSVLLHDVGKADTASVDETGRIRFFGHEVRGAEIVLRIAERLHFSRRDSEMCAAAVRNHMRFANITAMRRDKLRRMIAAPGFFTELELHRLDCISCHGMMQGYTCLLDTIAADKSLTSLPPPLIRGRDLVAAGAKPSPRFKEVLEKIFSRQLQGEFTTAPAALHEALKLLKMSAE